MNHIRGHSQKNKKIISKRRFTLFEIVISMALMAMISSMFVYKGWDLICEQRFLSSARRIHNEVCAAKLNAIAYQVAINLTFSKKASKSVLVISASSIPKGLESMLGKEISLPNLELEKEVVFYSNGFCSFHEELVLKPIKGKAKDRLVSLLQIDRMKVA